MSPVKTVIPVILIAAMIVFSDAVQSPTASPKAAKSPAPATPPPATSPAPASGGSPPSPSPAADSPNSISGPPSEAPAPAGNGAAAVRFSVAGSLAVGLAAAVVGGVLVM